eukprot:TRINITY_DN33526_c0_g1_i3.p1 TRINITY_DN33526_c0_g1~~TRINITY_DN33526_c0_g1_i3.p1  ORF type:complete len:442 (-),score=64.95 TRINITY_DN33526_c0_g1_i3:116-1441(-)
MGLAEVDPFYDVRLWRPSSSSSSLGVRQERIQGSGAVAVRTLARRSKGELRPSSSKQLAVAGVAADGSWAQSPQTNLGDTTLRGQYLGTGGPACVRLGTCNATKKQGRRASRSECASPSDAMAVALSSALIAGPLKDTETIDRLHKIALALARKVAQQQPEAVDALAVAVTNRACSLLLQSYGWESEREAAADLRRLAELARQHCLLQNCQELQDTVAASLRGLCKRASSEHGAWTEEDCSDDDVDDLWGPGRLQRWANHAHLLLEAGRQQLLSARGVREVQRALEEELQVLEQVGFREPAPGWRAAHKHVDSALDSMRQTGRTAATSVPLSPTAPETWVTVAAAPTQSPETPTLLNHKEAFRPARHSPTQQRGCLSAGSWRKVRSPPTPAAGDATVRSVPRASSAMRLERTPEVMTPLQRGQVRVQALRAEIRKPRSFVT